MALLVNTYAVLVFQTFFEVLVLLSFRYIVFGKIIPPRAHKGIYDGKGLMYGYKPTFSDKK